MRRVPVVAELVTAQSNSEREIAGPSGLHQVVGLTKVADRSQRRDTDDTATEILAGIQLCHIPTNMRFRRAVPRIGELVEQIERIRRGIGVSIRRPHNERRDLVRDVDVSLEDELCRVHDEFDICNGRRHGRAVGEVVLVVSIEGDVGCLFPAPCGIDFALALVGLNDRLEIIVNAAERFRLNHILSAVDHLAAKLGVMALSTRNPARNKLKRGRALAP